MSENTNPYDVLFRAAFAEPRAAKSLSLFLLPRARTQGFASAKVTVEPESLVDQEARVHRTDLLLEFTWPARAKAKAGRRTGSRRAYVYVLYEHKSSPYKWVTVQLLRYMATIWQRLIDDTERHTGGLLPDILPVVIYHGKEKWGGPPSFAELIDGGPSAPHVPHYQPVFINITTLADREITGSLRLVLGLVALKYTRLEMDEAAEELLTDLFHRGMAHPRTRYLVRVAQQVYTLVKPEKVVDRLVAVATRKGYHEIEGGYMTWAEAKRREGVEEGLEQGVQQGTLQSKRETLIRLLDRKFGLTDSERERISSCSDQAALDVALDEFALAEAKAQVLKKLP